MDLDGAQDRGSHKRDRQQSHCEKRQLRAVTEQDSNLKRRKTPAIARTSKMGPVSVRWYAIDRRTGSRQIAVVYDLKNENGNQQSVPERRLQ